MILLIDNYDSFTYNLTDYFAQLGEEILLFKNDEIQVSDLSKLNFDKIVISPGPNRPKDSGNLMSIIPQQLVNTGRSVSSFFMDKVNGYEGNPSQSSYLPYNQPIDNINDVDLINYF